MQSPGHCEALNMVCLVVLSLGVIFLGNLNQIYCAEEPSDRLFFEDCVIVIEEETPLPTVLSRLVAEYREKFAYRLHQSFPAEDFPCVEHALSDQLLACVNRDGDVIIKSLKTNEVLKRIELVVEDKAEYCAERPVTSFNDHLIIPMDFRSGYSGGRIVILNTTTDQSISFPDPGLRSLKDFVFVPLPNDELFVSYAGSRNADIVDVKTGTYKQKIESRIFGWHNAALLSDGRFVIASNDLILFSQFDSFLARADNVDHAASACIEVYKGPLNLKIFDTKTLSELSSVQFENEHDISLAPLSDGDIAVKKEKSGEVDVFYSQGERVTLPIGKRAHTIQGVPSGDLFVTCEDGSNLLFGKQFNQAMYEQQKAEMLLKKKMREQQEQEDSDARCEALLEFSDMVNTMKKMKIPMNATNIGVWHAYNAILQEGKNKRLKLNRPED